MKTIFTSITLCASILSFAQANPPNLDWSKNYKINDLSIIGLDVENNSNYSFIARDSFYDTGTGNYLSNHHLVKMNQNNIISDNILSIPGSTYFDKLVVTQDNGYLTSNEMDGSLYKYNVNGNLLWKKTFGSDFYVSDFIKTNDANILTIGTNNEEGNLYYLIQKMDNNSNVIWKKEAEKLNNAYYMPSKILQTNDNGYLIAGAYVNLINSEYPDGYSLHKIDALGNTLWEKRYTIPANVEIWAEKILQSTDGGYLILSEYDDDNGNDVGDFLGKYDSAGNLVWSKNLSSDFSVTDIINGFDNGYILSIYDFESNNSSLYKINDNGDFVWTKNYNNMGSLMNIGKTNDGFIALGNIEDSGKNSINILKFGTITASTSDVKTNKIQIFPNPTKDLINIKLSENEKIGLIEIYDSSGKLIKTDNNASKIISVKDFPEGKYIIKLYLEQKIISQKFIKN